MTNVQMNLYNSDFLLNSIKSESVDLIIVDPPYGIMNGAKEWRGKITASRQSIYNFDIFKSDEELLAFTERWMQECYRVLKDGGSIYVFSDILLRFKDIIKKYFKIYNVIFWHKTNPVPKFAKKNYLTSVECTIFAVKGEKPCTFNFSNQRDMHNFIELPVVAGKKRYCHPTQKPEELIEKLIQVSSKEGEIVLDPFMGTNTTGAVCKKLGRNMIGFEINKEYFKICERRVQGG